MSITRDEMVATLLLLGCTINEQRRPDVHICAPYDVLPKGSAGILLLPGSANERYRVREEISPQYSRKLFTAGIKYGQSFDYDEMLQLTIAFLERKRNDN